MNMRGFGTLRNEDPRQPPGRQDSIILLITCVPLLIIGPTLPLTNGTSFFIPLFLTFFLIGSLYSLRNDRQRLLTGFISTLISIELFWMSFFSSSPSLFLFGELIFFFYLVVLSFNQGLSVSSNTKNPLDLGCAIAAFVLSSGLCIGTGLHIAMIISKPLILDLDIIPGFIDSLLSGVRLMTPAGIQMETWSHGDVMPLQKVVLTLGSLAGYGVMLFSIGKIIGTSLKKD